jgi:hypothetical protein
MVGRCFAVPVAFLETQLVVAADCSERARHLKLISEAKLLGLGHDLSQVWEDTKLSRRVHLRMAATGHNSH